MTSFAANRSAFSRVRRFALVGAVALGLSGCGVNTIPTAQENAKATSGQLNTGDLTDPAKMKAFQDAQNQLSQSIGGLGRLLANSEAYPEVKSIGNYQMLQSQLEGQENRVRIAIRDYNEAVQEYNTTIRTFPAMVAARIIYSSQPMVPYQAVTPGAEAAPSLEGKL